MLHQQFLYGTHVPGLNWGRNILCQDISLCTPSNVFSAEGHNTFSEGLSWAGFPQKNRDGDVCKGVLGASKIILVSSLKEYGQSQNNLSGSNKIRQHRSLLVGSPKKRGDNLGFAYGHLSLWALGGVSHVGTFESSSQFLKSNIRPGSAKQFDLVGKNHANQLNM